jgi:protein-tyrosine phosphatase
MSPTAAPLRFAGTHNSRSLRGTGSHDGRRIAGDIVLRSDRLNSLTREDWATLQALERKTISDLRGMEERPHASPQLLADFRLNMVQFDIRNDVRSNPELAALVDDSSTAEGAGCLMHGIFRRFPKAFAEHLAEWFILLSDGVPMLVHCTEGKDRTGFDAASLQCLRTRCLEPA